MPQSSRPTGRSQSRWARTSASFSMPAGRRRSPSTTMVTGSLASSALACDRTTRSFSTYATRVSGWSRCAIWWTFSAVGSPDQEPDDPPQHGTLSPDTDLNGRQRLDDLLADGAVGRVVVLSAEQEIVDTRNMRLRGIEGLRTLLSFCHRPILRPPGPCQQVCVCRGTGPGQASRLASGVAAELQAYGIEPRANLPAAAALQRGRGGRVLPHPGRTGRAGLPDPRGARHVRRWPAGGGCLGHADRDQGQHQCPDDHDRGDSRRSDPLRLSRRLVLRGLGYSGRDRGGAGEGCADSSEIGLAPAATRPGNGPAAARRASPAMGRSRREPASTRLPNLRPRSTPGSAIRQARGKTELAVATRARACASGRPSPMLTAKMPGAARARAAAAVNSAEIRWAGVRPPANRSASTRSKEPGPACSRAARASPTLTRIRTRGPGLVAATYLARVRPPPPRCSARNGWPAGAARSIRWPSRRTYSNSR